MHAIPQKVPRSRKSFCSRNTDVEIKTEYANLLGYSAGQEKGQQN